MTLWPSEIYVYSAILLLACAGPCATRPPPP